MANEAEMNDITPFWVLKILEGWNGIWYKYDALLQELEAEYNVKISRYRCEKILKELVKTGEVVFGPCYNSDMMISGSGYFHKDGDGWA